MAIEMSEDLRTGAMVYHRGSAATGARPGKIEIKATKPLGNQRDLALAYSPGVAAVCDAIAENPDLAADLTIRQNLVAVLTNGTAVLGMGDIGPLASKPVMEGKAVLFKKFAGIDVFDIEVAEKDAGRLIEVVCALEPTFGGINLEDIKAPECFEVEEACRERMGIPVFHDDQHGTAIIVAAAIVNGLELAEKKLPEVKIVTSGAGAAALACLNLLVTLGARRENIWVTDIEGVVHEGRAALMDRWKSVYAQKTDKRTLGEVIDGADVFLGLSAGGVLKVDMVERMASMPMIMALANPIPEIMPDLARQASPGAMICTGRSDFPNQVNNVLCFPYIFRGALDVGATQINEAMKAAAVQAIAALAREPSSDIVTQAYGGVTRLFGPDSLIPSPFDPRLILRIAPAVAKAAMATGVAVRPIADFRAYEEQLNRFVFRSGFIMKPVFAAARAAPKRVIYAEGEDERALRAAQVALEEGIATPILIGRPHVIDVRARRFGLTYKPGVDVEIVNPEDDRRYRDYVSLYFERAGRRGVSPDRARTIVRTNATVIGALAIERGDADAMICGLEGRFREHLQAIDEVIGKAPDAPNYSALALLISGRGAYFLADPYVTPDPDARTVAECAVLCAKTVARFGLTPKIALLSHANFGADDTPSARKMRDALALIRKAAPELEVDGEMTGDVALRPELRERVMPGSHLSGEANLLIFPNLDAAHIAVQLIKSLADALPVGPILIGAAKPAHILTPSVTARGVVNMTALAVVEAQVQAPAI